MLSYELWQQRFGGSPAAIGKTITLGGGAHTIIGVLSPSFKAQPPADAWMPLQADPNSTDQAHIYMVSGRLREGVTLAQANSEIAVVGKRYILMHPEQLGRDHSLQVSSLQERVCRARSPR